MEPAQSLQAQELQLKAKEPPRLVTVFGHVVDIPALRRVIREMQSKVNNAKRLLMEAEIVAGIKQRPKR